MNGRYSIRSFPAFEYDKKKGIFEDGLRFNLKDVNISENDNVETDCTTDEVLIGWAGSVTESVDKVVEVKIRIFFYIGDGLRLERNISLPANANAVEVSNGQSVLILDGQMRGFITFLFAKFMENIKLELKRRELEIRQCRKTFDFATQTEDEEDVKSPLVPANRVNWEEISKQMMLRVLEVVHRYQKLGQVPPKCSQKSAATFYGVKETRV